MLTGPMSVAASPGALPACGAPEPAPVAAPTADALAAGQWRLLSPVFAALPAGGYPIGFQRDGAAQTANLAGVTGWVMPAAGRLELTGGGRVLYGFLWSERHGAFRHVIAGGTAAGLSMVIVPADLAGRRAPGLARGRGRAAGLRTPRRSPPWGGRESTGGGLRRQEGRAAGLGVHPDHGVERGDSTSAAEGRPIKR